MDQGRRFETAGIISENRILFFSGGCLYRHPFFFVGEFLVTALQSEKSFCLEKRRRTAYSDCPKFFSSCIKSSGIIDELSLKNKSSWIILSV